MVSSSDSRKKHRSSFRYLPVFLGAGIGAALLTGTLPTPAVLHAAETGWVIPAPKIDADERNKKLGVAILAGGCFWGVEGVFSHVKGVKHVSSGYHGGEPSKARYDLVAYGKTNHAEAVRIIYDPKQISYGQLLQIFFSVTADPTQLNRQGPDTGRHYRNAIIPIGKKQEQTAKAYIAQLKKAKIWSKPIVTAIEPYAKFYKAETYHQNFMFKNPAHPYIVRWDRVKVSNLKRLFPKLYSAKPSDT